MADSIRLNALDDVVVALGQISCGAEVEPGVIALDTVEPGHKVATRFVRQGQPVHKYGQVIGVATADIQPGEAVHTHNLGAGDLHLRADASAAAAAAPVRIPTPRTFNGYLRADGRVGTRNYLGVVTSVNCSAMVAKRIARQVEDALGDFPNVDGVVAITHGGGCAMATTGDGIDVLRRTLAGYAKHPNFHGVLMLGLGCETNQLAGLMAAEGLEADDQLASMAIQTEGGTTAAIAAGVERLLEMARQADRQQRTPLPLSHLTLGLQCGGSDGYSGVTANPALGVAADLLVQHGGGAILSETPEIYGAEHLLLRRASPEVAEKLMQRIAWWENYVATNGGSMDNNPSAGNKAGGLTTILEKSLGAVAKAGSSPLTAVYEYAEQVTARGLSFMDTPGYDPVSATGQVAGGANLICFTTGRGSVFGCKPAPSLKLSTNSALYARMRDDMDINCGEILDAGVSIETMGERIFDLIVETASGHKTKSEILGFGEDEIQPWRIGAVM